MCVPTGTLHAVKQGVAASAVCLLLQMSHTRAQPLIEPEYPWGSSPGRPHLKTEQGEQESTLVQCMAGVGAPFWRRWQSLEP